MKEERVSSERDDLWKSLCGQELEEIEVKDFDESKDTLLEYGEFGVRRGQYRVEGTDRHLTGPLTLFFDVHFRKCERTVSTKVAVAWIFFNDDLRFISVKRFPEPRTLLHTAACYAF